MTLSLMDALGVLIAFITVVLLLSVLVTALVQSTQSVFRTRGRNLHKALWRLMVKDLDKGKADAQSAAHKLLGGTLASLIKREPRKGWWAKLLGPAVSWIEPAEIADAARRAGLVPDAEGEASAPPGERLDPAAVETLTKGVEAMELPMKKRLGFTMRWISIGWAVLVAVAFQVSTLDLLRDLSADEDLRTKILDIEQEQIEQKLTEPAGTSAALADLAPLSIQLWDDPGFYCAKGVLDEGERVSRWRPLRRIFRCKDGDLAPGKVVGVAITAFLLTFGAPFWFKQLQVAVGLRDALKKPEPTEGGGEGT